MAIRGNHCPLCPPQSMKNGFSVEHCSKCGKRVCVKHLAYLDGRPYCTGCERQFERGMEKPRGYQPAADAEFIG